MQLDVQGGDYEHILDLAGAAPAGLEIGYRKVGLAALSKTVLGGQPFGAAEYSLANHIMLHASGARPLAAIPVFPSRAFRNTSVFVARHSPLATPSDLAGKRIAVSEFAMTAAVWARGHLHDTYGLDWRDVEWITAPNPRFPAPEGVRISHREGDLEHLVLDGGADAIITGRPKDIQRPPAERRLRCLIADPAAAERSYFAETGIFPIMHTVVFHEDVPDVVDAGRALFEAYVTAKKRAIERRLSASFLPFAERNWDSFYGGGADPCAYGLTAANRRTIAALSRYLREQGFIDREPEPESLFLPGSAAWIDA